MKTRRLRIGALTFLLVAQAAVAQTAVAPPPNPAAAARQTPAAPRRKPAESGPSLKVTMQFIQEMMNNHGTVGYVYTRSDWNGVTFRDYYTISGVTADAATCSLHKTETTLIIVEPAQGYNWNENGQPVTGDDLTRRDVQVSTVALKSIESIRVESMQDQDNRDLAESAHPELTVGIVPPVYYLTLVASRPVFSFHQTFIEGKRQPSINDSTDKQDRLRFRDEETANRLAKALVHAVELCGGGNKEPF